MLFAERVAIFDPAFFKREDKEKKERKSPPLSGRRHAQLLSVHLPEAQDHKAACPLMVSVPHFRFPFLECLFPESAVGH